VEYLAILPLMKCSSLCMPVKICVDSVDFWLKCSSYATGIVFSPLVAILCFLLISPHGIDHELNGEVENPLKTLQTRMLIVC
jgi:hypothetical protein